MLEKEVDQEELAYEYAKIISEKIYNKRNRKTLII